jgi:hypothetical protein
VAAGILFQFLLAGLLWKKSALIARWLTVDGSLIILRAQLDADRVMQVVFAAMGLWLLVSGLRELSQYVLFAVVAVQSHSPFWEYWRNTVWRVHFWSTLVALAAGIYLMLGAKGIIRAMRYLQRTDFEDQP